MNSKYKDKLVGVYAPGSYDHTSVLGQTQEFSRWFWANHEDMEYISAKLGISAKKLGKDIEIYPIGIDIENKNHHFINLNLADYSRLFGNNTLFDTLDKLPKPDLIIASPPCESWSNASAMDRGNACWKQEQGDSLFQPQEPLSIFTIRDHKDYDRYQFYPNKQLMKRINGELCVFNTVEIIKRYKPKYWI